MQEIFLPRPASGPSECSLGFLWEFSIILISFKLSFSEVLNLIIDHSYSEGSVIEYYTRLENSWR